MPRRGYCASCGKEVWQGRDGGCQFGHPASEFSNAHDADLNAPPAGGSPYAPRPRPVQPAPAPQAYAPAPPPQAYAAAPQPYDPTPPAAQAVAAGAAAAPAAVPEPWGPPPEVPGYPPVGSQPAAPSDEAWGHSPDEYGRPQSAFDYAALTNEVSIGNTDCLVKRCVARILDNFLVGAVSFMFVVPWFIASAAQMQNTNTQPSSPSWLTPLSLLIYGLNFILLPYLWKGRTLGKWILGIAVTDLHDHAPTVVQLIIRELSMIVDGLFYGILGLFIASRNPRTQRLGDQWAETVVVRTR